MKKLKILPWFLLLFSLVGCSLAQPEYRDNAENEDQFVGFYVVFGEKNLDRSNWVEYSSEDVDTEFGTFTIPREVLFANYEEEKGWIFEGLDGYSAFATEVDDRTTGTEGLQRVHIGYGNNACTKLQGTIYIEQSPKDYYVTYYNVYETSDGRIYTDGSGNSMSSPATSGGAMSTKKENTYRENGKIVEAYEYEVSVDIEPVIPTTRLVLVQYDENDVELSREEMGLEEQHIVPHSKTAWMVVIEEDKEGALHRTAYEPPTDEEDRVAHSFYFPKSYGTIEIYSIFFDMAEE